MKRTYRSHLASINRLALFFNINTMKRNLMLLILIVLSWQNHKVNAQQKLEDVAILHPKTKDTLLVAYQVIKEVKQEGIILLQRQKNTYQMSFYFPYHSWKADFSQAEWNTKTDVIRFNNADGLSGFCLSEMPMHRGLEISSVNAKLYIVPKSLTLEGIAGIRVANGWVVPSEPKRITLSGENIPTLKNATLLLNAFSRYHKITNCTIVLESRFSYKIEGGTFNYQRISDEKNTETFLFKNFAHKSKVVKHFDEIGIVTEIMVEVVEKDKFYLTDGRLFKGKMLFVDSSPNPSFNGKAKQEGKPWEKYKSK